MKIGSSTARGFVWIALAAQLAFVAAWVVAGALQPGYSHVQQGISELGADSAAHPLIVNAGLVALGIGVAAVGIALFAALPSRLACALFVCAGLALMAAGLIPLECGLNNDACERMWRAGQLGWREDAHLWAALAAQAFIGLTPFALARALWPGPAAPLALGAGAVAVALGAGSFLLAAVHDSPDGLVQRVGLVVVHLWVLVVGAAVLHALRSPPAPGPLVRLRPRDFFAREWTGSGELVVAPFPFWRRFPQRMEARRSSTWISEHVWRIDDEARFGPDRVQRRRMFCQFVSPERVEITGGDMPDGAVVLVEEEGFRTVPFRMRFPLGPVGVPVRVHDVSRVEPDGTLVNAFEARMLGVTIAVTTFRVRPL